MTTAERVYLWVVGLAGMILLEARLAEAWANRLERRYWARQATKR